MMEEEVKVHPAEEEENLPKASGLFDTFYTQKSDISVVSQQTV